MQSFSLGKKLSISFALMLLFVMVLGVGNYFCSFVVNARLDTTKSAIEQANLAGQLVESVQGMRSEHRGMIMYTYGKDPQRVAKAKEEFVKNLGTAQKVVSAIEPMAVSDEDRKLVAIAKKDVELIGNALNEEYRLLMEDKPDDARQFANKTISPLYAEIVQLSPMLAERSRKTLAASERDIETEMAKSTIASIVFSALGLIVGAGVMVIVRRATRQLREVTSELSEGAEQVASAAAQVSGASQSLAQGASESASSLQATASSATQVAANTQSSAQHSQEAAKIVNDEDCNLKSANQKIEEMVSSINELNDSSNEIAKIIKVIDAIAFQTNILALNAAVEAARAGDAGSGFAVVADEVRNLAQRCAQAAKDTSTLIETSIQKTHQSSESVQSVAKAIEQIVGGSATIKQLVDEVALATKEQSTGLESIQGSVTQLELVTQKNAAVAEESAAAGEELSAQANTLQGLVKRLTVVVEGQTR